MVQQRQGNGRMNQEMEWTLKTRNLLRTKKEMRVSLQP